MNPNRSLTPTALGWIREDLDRLLETTRRQAESIAGNPRSGHVVYEGTIDTVERLAEIFQTLGIDGARQVTRAMLNLLQSAVEDQGHARDAAGEQLLDAMVVLPAYLDRLQAGHADLPILVLPLINRLREAHGESPLSEGTVFTPLLDVELPELEYVEKPGYDEPFEYLTARLQRQLESALSEWQQDTSQVDLLAAKQGILETLRHRVKRYDLKRLWWVATEIIGGLEDGHVENDAQLRGLLSRLCLLIGSMSEKGEDGIDLETSTAVTQALLFHIGRARPGCPGVDLVRERFQLDELSPDEEALLQAQGTISGRDREMYRSLSAAVEDELVMVKDSLDLELRTGQVDPDRRRQSVEALSRLGDTLAMLGQSGAGEALTGLIPTFESSADTDRESRDATLVNLAEQLLLIESSLQEQIETLGVPLNGEAQDGLIPLSSHERRRIRCQLLDQCVVSAHQSQDAVRKALSGDYSVSATEPVGEIAGALDLAEDTEAATRARHLQDAIQDMFDSTRSGRNVDDDGSRIDLLADAMAALELYLAANRDLQQDSGRFLDIIDNRLQALAAPGVAAEPATETELYVDGATGSAVETPTRIESNVIEPFSQTAPTPIPESEQPGAPPTNFDERPSEPEPEREPERVPEPEPEPELDQVPEIQPETESESQTVPEPTWQPTLETEPEQAPVAESVVAASAETADKFEDRAEETDGAEDEAGMDTLPPPIDPELRDIFLEEYETVLETLQQNIPDWMASLENAAPLTEIRRAFHTLKGSGRMVGAEELGDFSWHIEEMLNNLLEGQIENFADVSTMVRLAQAALPALRQRMLQQATGLRQDVIELIGANAHALAGGGNADWSTLGQRLPAYLATLLPEGYEAPPHAEPGRHQGRQTDATRDQLAGHMGPIQSYLEAVSRDRAARADEVQRDAARAISTLLADDPDGRDADIAGALSRLMDAQAGSGATFAPDALFTLVSAVSQLQGRLERLDGSGEDVDQAEQDELVKQLDQLASHFEHAAPAGDFGGFDPGKSVFAGGDEAQAGLEDTPHFEEAPIEAAQDVGTAGFAPEPTPGATSDFDQLDAEIMGIFLEEAEEVLDRGDAALDEWRNDVDELRWVRNLQREIHTFKGGARMAGLTSLGDYTHEMETLLERIADRALPPTLAAVQLLEEANDRLHVWVKQVKARTVPDASQALGQLTQQIDSLNTIETAATTPTATPVPMTPAPGPGPTLTPESTETAEETETAAAGDTIDSLDAALEDLESALDQRLEARKEQQPEPAARDLPEVAEEPEEQRAEATGAQGDRGQAQIRVSAELLDKLVNAASEVSIYRSRIEQQVSNLRGNLGEFDKTLDRLHEQFRKMEIETEVQIRSNYPDANQAGDSDFDPLELDQFSTLQQLSRSLSESVSDLLNLQEMLEESARNSEQLLQRQSRVSTELQEGLMKTRMVPFGSIASRLRRLVRGAAKETDKKANLQMRVVGTSDELDRNVLEHITAPLEHMMRNAVVHGIESPADRKSAGKTADGEITITVESEATEFVIRIADDGAGINLDAIRERAIDRGLLAADAEPSREQLYEFMMDSGFSTSSKVTKLAGRGVGMDVVSSDIKQIGGSLEIDSERGQGTQFTIRIPFTLAIMQAIGVVAGENEYLLPLSSVAGVSRILPDEYQALIEQDNPTFRFAGQEYPILDIEPLLGEPSNPSAGRDNVTLLILNAGEQKAALRVPQLEPHREVVIKPVGPQISCIPGILGGAIAGDGRVVVILDPGPLIRHAMLHGVSPIQVVEAVNGDAARKLVMVVDDSITMRKVTSRVLESNDYEVLTARDGVDALEQLEERTPDVMLLDIEMPRMDGYELTERVRSSARLRNTPIMMITSRAGQKHRERAERLGANAYLTKPYSESELLSEVQRLLQENGG